MKKIRIKSTSCFFFTLPNISVVHTHTFHLNKAGLVFYFFNCSFVMKLIKLFACSNTFYLNSVHLYIVIQLTSYFSLKICNAEIRNIATGLTIQNYNTSEFDVKWTKMKTQKSKWDVVECWTQAMYNCGNAKCDDELEHEDRDEMLADQRVGPEQVSSLFFILNFFSLMSERKKSIEWKTGLRWNRSH